MATVKTSSKSANIATLVSGLNATEPSGNSPSQFARQRQKFHGVRYEPGNSKGHYESYFLRANHPDRALGFWIRYTIFSPKSHPEKALGELWVIYFDGETQKVIAVKEEAPLEQCSFAKDQIKVNIRDAQFEAGDNGGFLRGEARAGKNTVVWNLHYKGDNEPLYDFPEKLYATAFPKAKALVSNPNVIFSGKLIVNGQEIIVNQWQGSENHNWGSRHTDEYAWGQVAGFDNNKNAFLECATARIKLGPFWSPWMTLLVLRIDGEEIRLNDVMQSVKAKGQYSYFKWRFCSKKSGFKVSGWIRGGSQLFAGLNYYNPPGGSHTCLNCKIAEAEVFVEREGLAPVRLYTKNRAAFEILTDDKEHGIVVMA